MVADNKQQSASDKAILTTVKVGDGEQIKPGRRLLTPKISKRNLFLTVLIVVVLAAGWMVISKTFHIGQKVYAQAAGHKIYKQDIDNLIDHTKGVSDRQAAAVLADKYLTEAMVKEAKITVSSQDIKAKYPDIDKQKTSNKYVYQSNVNTVYFNKLQAYNTGLYTGKLLVANFSRHIAFQSPFLELQKATDPLMGNPVAVAADKKYAQDFITKLYDQVKSNKTTFDQAIQTERNDPTLGMNAYQTLPHSGSFDTSNIYLGATALIAPQSIQQKIKDMKAGQLSAPFVVSVNNSLTGQKSTTDSYYLVVKMDSTAGGSSGLSYDQYLTQAKKQFGYKIYV